MNKHEKPLVIAVIPARGGSKGIRKKNIKNLCGKPLIGYTIETAKAVSTIDHVVVSTEDDEIAEVSKSFGAFVPFLRPKELAMDDSNLSHVLDHMHYGLKEIINFTSQYILISMFTTSPFRNVNTIEKLVEKSIAGFHVITVNQKCKSDWYYSMEKTTDKLLPLNGLDLHIQNTNNILYRNYGNFLSCAWNYPNPCHFYYHIIDNQIELIDIDNYEDFFLAEEIINNQIYDFGFSTI